MKRPRIRPMAPGHKVARGFSLIEVLVTILIFSFALLGMVALQAKATQFSVSAEDTNRAALLASDLSATMYASRTVNLAPAVVNAWKARVADPSTSGVPGGVGSVVVAGNTATITITWVPPKAKQGAAPNSYVTQVVQ